MSSLSEIQSGIFAINRHRLVVSSPTACSLKPQKEGRCIRWRTALAQNYLLGWFCLFVEVFGLGAVGRDLFNCFGPGFPYIVEETVPKTSLQTKWPGEQPKPLPPVPSPPTGPGVYSGPYS